MRQVVIKQRVTNHPLRRRSREARHGGQNPASRAPRDCHSDRTRESRMPSPRRRSPLACPPPVRIPVTPQAATGVQGVANGVPSSLRSSLLRTVRRLWGASPTCIRVVGTLETCPTLGLDATGDSTERVVGANRRDFAFSSPRRKGDVGAISPAAALSSPRGRTRSTAFPARRDCVRLGSAVLVNGRPVFPIRPADGGSADRLRSSFGQRPGRSSSPGSRWGGRVRTVPSRGRSPVRVVRLPCAIQAGQSFRPRAPDLPSDPAAPGPAPRPHAGWPSPARQLPSRPISPQIRCLPNDTPDVIYARPLFFVHTVHFAVPVRPPAILPDGLVQFRGTFFKQSRANRGWWEARRCRSARVRREDSLRQAPQPPVRSTRRVVFV